MLVGSGGPVVIALMGCARVEGTWAFEGVHLAWNPQPDTWSENVTDGVHAMDLATAPYVVDTGYELALEYTYEAQPGRITLRRGELTLEIFDKLLRGDRDGDAWALHYSAWSEVVQTEHYGDGYSIVVYQRTGEELDLRVTVDGGEATATGTDVYPVTDGFREPDEWKGGDGYGTLPDVYTEDGVPVENRGRRDDCEGDACEVSYTSNYSAYDLSFTGYRLGR
jgi:hypothetical protein